MKFSLETKELREILESIQVKGKYAGTSGYTNSSLGTIVQMSLTDNTLTIYNGDATFIVRADIEVNGIENGQCICDVSTILSYLKTFGETTMFHSVDFITLSSDRKKATVPRIIQHDTSNYDRVTALLKDVQYSAIPNELPKFNQHKFEGCFTIDSGVFSSCMQSMELVKAGTFKIDFTDAHALTLSSRQSVENRYEETVFPSHSLGEGATVEFTSPLHKFFKKNQNLNFFVRDDFPILIMAYDRLVLKAPAIN